MAFIRRSKAGEYERLTGAFGIRHNNRSDRSGMSISAMSDLDMVADCV